MKAKVSIITLGVRDIARSLVFYRDGLGFKPHNYRDGDDHVMFKMDGSWLSLYPRDKLAEDATVPDDGRGFSGITLTSRQNRKSTRRLPRPFAPAQNRSSSRRTSSGVVTPDISPIPTAISGKWPSIRLPI